VIGDTVEATRGRSLLLISHREGDVAAMDAVWHHG
jgi:hypothetical protein